MRHVLRRTEESFPVTKTDFDKTAAKSSAVHQLSATVRGFARSKEAVAFPPLKRIDFHGLDVIAGAAFKIHRACVLWADTTAVNPSFD